VAIYVAAGDGNVREEGFGGWCVLGGDTGWTRAGLETHFGAQLEHTRRRVDIEAAVAEAATP